jgi:AcrR family transcriptional regulator
VVENLHLLTPAEKRLHVLRAAIEVLAERGYEGTRLQDVARAAGVSVGLLQHYFGTRENLLSEAFEQVSRDRLDAYGEMVGGDEDPWRRIVTLVEQVVLDPHLTENAAIWTEFAASAARHPSLRAPLRRTYDGWRALVFDAIADGVRLGVFRPRFAVDDVVDLVVTILDGAELAVNAEIGSMSGERMRALVLSAAGLALGLPVGEAEPTAV